MATIPETMTPAEAAAALQLPKATVLSLCRRGVLPARKLGRNWRVYRAGLKDVFARAGTAGSEGADRP